MIGNDIIDLRAARRDSNWQRPRFLDKLFSKQEQYLIQTSANPETLLWTLWSMKESAYKVWIQNGARRSFQPKKFCCRLESGGDMASVSINDMVFYTHSFVSDNYIYTIASKQEKLTIATVVSQIFSLPRLSKETSSEAVYNKLLTCYADKAMIPLKNLSIKKTIHGVPFLLNKDNRLEVSISLTHHGAYGAYTWI